MDYIKFVYIEMEINYIILIEADFNCVVLTSASVWVLL